MKKSGTLEVIPQWAIPQMTPTEGCGLPTPLFSALLRLMPMPYIDFLNSLKCFDQT